MARLTISSTSDGKKINQDDKIRFKIKTDLDGEVLSPFIDIDFPKFPPLMGSSLGSFTYSSENRTAGFSDLTVNYSIAAYGQSSDSRGNKFLTLKIYDEAFFNTIRIDTKLTIKTSGTIPTVPLSVLNNNTYTVSEMNTTAGKTNGFANKWFKLKLTGFTSNLSPLNQTLGTVITSSVTAGALRDIPYKTYTISSTDSNILKSMLWNDYVRDVLVFTFSQSKTAIVPTDKKYIFTDTVTGINQLTLTNYSSITAPTDTVPIPPTPTYSQVAFLYKKRKAKINIFDSNGPFVEFYITVVRYKKDSSGNWNGEWLQTKDNSIIWSKATLG